MKWIRSIAVAALLGLSACAANAPVPTPQSPAQVVYALHGAYASALVVAVKYRELPRCGTGPLVCSDPGVIKQVQTSDDRAFSALSAAQSAVRTPGFGQDRIATAVTSAKALVQAFTEITATLKVSQ